MIKDTICPDVVSVEVEKFIGHKKNAFKALLILNDVPFKSEHKIVMLSPSG